jgi:hypothetical protein
MTSKALYHFVIEARRGISALEIPREGACGTSALAASSGWRWRIASCTSDSTFQEKSVPPAEGEEAAAIAPHSDMELRVRKHVGALVLSRVNAEAKGTP